MEEKQGHVKGAFNRPEIGDIDLIWGDDNAGLQHIIKRRAKQGVEGIVIINKVSHVMAHGIFGEDKDKFVVEYDGTRVLVKPHFDGEKVNCLVNGYDVY